MDAESPALAALAASAKDLSLNQHTSLASADPSPVNPTVSRNKATRVESYSKGKSHSGGRRHRQNLRPGGHWPVAEPSEPVSFGVQSIISSNRPGRCTDLAPAANPQKRKSLKSSGIDGGADGTRTRDPRRDRPVFTSLSMSEGERALSISADYALPFPFARARFCSDIRKTLEKSDRESALQMAALDWTSHSRRPDGTLTICETGHGPHRNRRDAQRIYLADPPSAQRAFGVPAPHTIGEPLFCRRRPGSTSWVATFPSPPRPSDSYSFRRLLTNSPARSNPLSPTTFSGRAAPTADRIRNTQTFGAHSDSIDFYHLGLPVALQTTLPLCWIASALRTALQSRNQSVIQHTAFTT